MERKCFWTSARCGSTDSIIYIGYNRKKQIMKKRLLKLYQQLEGLRKINILKDSPTCTKESLRLILTLIVSNRWSCNAIDIKSASIKLKQIEKPVFFIPPPECQEQNIVRKLKSCIYNLSDASREWYLKNPYFLIKTKIAQMGHL